MENTAKKTRFRVTVTPEAPAGPSESASGPTGPTDSAVTTAGPTGPTAAASRSLVGSPGNRQQQPRVFIVYDDSTQAAERRVREQLAGLPGRYAAEEESVEQSGSLGSTASVKGK